MKFNSTSRLLTALLFSVTLFLPMVSHAANLISIVVADTKDHSIGESVKIDFERMQTMMREAAKFTELNPIEIHLEGNDTTPSNLFKKMDELTVAPDDVVVFFFAGHGYHLTSESSTTPWPHLYFSQHGRGLFFEDVIRDLEAKNPRFLLAVADVCNSLIPDSYAPLRARAARFENRVDDIREHNYKQLFLETSGTVKITGASVSEFAWGGDNGGAFTRSFINSVNESVISTGGIDWNLILNKSYIQTALITSFAPSIQHPYFEMELSAGGSE